jgi:hypothetical protein
MAASRSSSAPTTRLLLALIVPVLAYLIAPSLLGGRGAPGALQLAALGVTAMLLGVQWLRAPALGLRGGRPLYAGIGFAALAWLAVLVIRFFTVRVAEYVGSGLGRTFLYLLLFEAFAVQLWLFGLLFRCLADWRGPLTAAAGSGLLFGVVAFFSFQESFSPAASALLYFIAWGALYGVIRLRTGSWLGMVPVQAMQSLTVWFLLEPRQPPDLAQLGIFHLVSSLAFLVLIWRLWPRRESDYRI